MNNKSVYIYLSDISVLYSGQTNGERSRFRKHRKEHPMCKDHPDGVFRVVGENLTQDKANDLERVWIEMFDLTNEGYNKLKAFSGSNVWTDEYKQWASKTRKGRKLSPEHRAKIGKASRGRKHTHEACMKISRGLKGKKKSLEHRRKLSLVTSLRRPDIQRKCTLSKLKNPCGMTMKDCQTAIDNGQLTIGEI